MKQRQLPSIFGKKKNNFSAFNLIILIILIVYVIGLFVPIIWSVIESFRDPDDYFELYTGSRDIKYLFSAPTFQNYKDAWEKLSIPSEPSLLHPEILEFDIFGLFQNSIIYTIGCALVQTLVPCVVAYCAARFKFKFSKILYIFVLFTMALPIVGSMPSELKMLRTLGISESYVGVFVLRAHFLCLYFLIFYAQFEQIPIVYTEAAKIDGASNLRIMLTVVFPQVFNLMITVFVLNFITYWNDYQIPLVYLPNYPTAAYALFYIINIDHTGSSIPLQMAATIIITLPIIIFFICLNKRLRVGVSVGGIKG